MNSDSLVTNICKSLPMTSNYCYDRAKARQILEVVAKWMDSNDHAEFAMILRNEAKNE